LADVATEVPIKQLIKVSAGTMTVPHLGSHLEGSGDHRSSGFGLDLSVKHRPGERTFELGARSWAMQMVNGARSVLDRRTGKFEHGWLGDSVQLDTQCPQGHAEITFIRDREMAQECAIAAQPAADADRLAPIGVLYRLIHRTHPQDN
jgi:hypothetical protein